jgi:hypothetical protein
VSERATRVCRQCNPFAHDAVFAFLAVLSHAVYNVFVIEDLVLNYVHEYKRNCYQTGVYSGHVTVAIHQNIASFFLLIVLGVLLLEIMRFVGTVPATNFSWKKKKAKEGKIKKDKKRSVIKLNLKRGCMGKRRNG